MYYVKTYKSLDELPASYSELFEQAGSQSFYLSFPWFDNLIRTTDEGTDLRLYGVEPTSNGGSPAALFITRSAVNGTVGPAANVLRSCANMYTILYGPVCHPTHCNIGQVAEAFARALTRERPRWAAIQFDSLDRDEPFYDAFARALKESGLMVQRYFHFGVYFEDVSHGSYDKYLSMRPSNLRNTLKRKKKRLDKTGRARFLLATGEEGLDEGLDAYERVYKSSWKDPEPFPRFTPGLARAAAAAECLRLGVIYVDNVPAAAQLWLVCGGKATIYKLAYDEHLANLSVGSILTAEIMRHVIEVDGVSVVDFGRGDDPYKATWLAQRRERWGILAFNPRTLAGLAGATRHIGGRAAKSALRTLRGRTASKASDGR